MSEYGEPWANHRTAHLQDLTDLRAIWTVNDEHVASAWGNKDDARSMFYQRRIVACVNACAGIPTDDLERTIGPSVRNTLGLVDRLAEAERLLRARLDRPSQAERDGCTCPMCTTTREVRAFLKEPQP